MREWRAKRKASQPEKPRRRSLEELSKLYRDGGDLTLEEMARLTAHKQRKAEDAKRFREKKRAGQPKKRTLKELAECSEAGLPLTQEESERLEAHRNKKKSALQDLKISAKTDPAAASELARQRTQQSEAVKKSRQKMYEDAASGDPEAQARYERYLATRRKNYHSKKHSGAGDVQAN